MLQPNHLLPGNVLQPQGMATFIMGAAGQTGGAIQLAAPTGTAGMQLGGLPMQAVLIPAQDGSLQIAYQFQQPIDNSQMQYQFVTQQVIQESPSTSIVPAQASTVNIQEPENIHVSKEVDDHHQVVPHVVVDNISTNVQQQQQEEHVTESSPSSNTKSTLDDPQRQCIIEFVDTMSPRTEQPQHHIANINYQQHPSPPPNGEQSSTSPTMKLKGTR